MSMGFLIGKLNKIWYFCAISIFETNTKSTIYSEHKAGAQEQPMGDLLTQCITDKLFYQMIVKHSYFEKAAAIRI